MQALFKAIARLHFLRSETRQGDKKYGPSHSSNFAIGEVIVARSINFVKLRVPGCRYMNDERSTFDNAEPFPPSVSASDFPLVSVKVSTSPNFMYLLIEI